MSYYKFNDEVYFFEKDQLHLVKQGMQKMTDVEVDKHINPEKYMTAQQRAEYKALTLGQITKRQLKLQLLEDGNLQAFEVAIAGIQDQTDKMIAEIEYLDSTSFKRTSNFIISIFTLIGFDTEAINIFWEKAQLK